ncbi:glycosyltransferase [Modestobacter sp. SYSU DS0511]
MKHLGSVLSTQQEFDVMAGSPTALKIFVPGVGQHENIGDIILRRQLLDRLRQLGDLHVYAGSSTDGYDEGLGLRPSDTVYRSFGRWYRRALVESVSGRATYVFKPGEIQLTLIGMKEHISMLPVVLAARLRGKAVVRLGVGSRNFSPLPRLLVRPSIAASNLTLWRDEGTSRYMRGGSMPDLAFNEGSPVPAMPSSGGRGLLVVSMRADRAPTPPNWYAAVNQTADRLGLKVLAVSQVLRDNPKTLELAQHLGAEAVTWSGERHGDQEAYLRSIYRETRLVVSDRLHVLVAGLTEGAVPAALLTDDSDKIERHFAAAGIHDVALRLHPEAAPEVASDWLTHVAGRRAELLTQLEVARRQIDDAFAQVSKLYHKKLPLVERDRVYQVGRRGDVAGGMTQVVNEYLSWDFECYEQGFIASRGTGSPIQGATLALSAAYRILTLRAAHRVVLVVHLSQRGSFVREGALLALGKLRGATVVAQIHGSSFPSFSRRRSGLVKLVLSLAHGIHVLSEETRKAVVAVAPAALVGYIPNAVSDGRPRNKRPLVVFGGSVARRKGVDTLLAAWGLAQPPAEWVLVVAGPITDPTLLPADLPPRVEFRGAVPHSELMELLESSQIAVLPSRNEAMPMFLIEAMARSNAVISTRVGGIPSLVGTESGTLLAPGEPQALAAAISEYILDDERRRAAQSAARARYLSTYSADVIRPQLETFWKTAQHKARKRNT